MNPKANEQMILINKQTKSYEITILFAAYIYILYIYNIYI